MIMMIWSVHPAPDPPGGVLLGNLGEGVPPGSPNPVHISDQKCHFPHPFSAQISKIHTHFQSWPNLACSRFSDSGGDSPVSVRFIFVFALSQFSGPNNLGAWNRLGIIGEDVCHHYQIRTEIKKNSSSDLKFAYFYFVLIHLELKRSISSSCHSRSFLESRPKWAKCFQTKRA